MNMEALREELRQQLLSDIDRRLEALRNEMIDRVEATIETKLQELEPPESAPHDSERRETVNLPDLQAKIAALLKERPGGLSSEAIADKLRAGAPEKTSPTFEDIRATLERGCHKHRDRGDEVKGAWLTSDQRDGETIYRLLGSAAVSS